MFRPTFVAIFSVVTIKNVIGREDVWTESSQSNNFYFFYL